jgi:Flp pilus assembly protein protease CpaA
MIRISVFITLLLLCVFYDISERKIPNTLLGAGILMGLLSSQSLMELFWKILAIFFLFFFGMLRLMGMGDLKLWMFLNSFVGFQDSCWIIIIAALLLILFGGIKNRTETVLIFRHILISIQLRKKPEIIEQTTYAFAPFVLAAAVLYLLKEVIM